MPDYSVDDRVVISIWTPDESQGKVGHISIETRHGCMSLWTVPGGKKETWMRYYFGTDKKLAEKYQEPPECAEETRVPDVTVCLYRLKVSLNKSKFKELFFTQEEREALKSMSDEERQQLEEEYSSSWRKREEWNYVSLAYELLSLEAHPFVDKRAKDKNQDEWKEDIYHFMELVVGRRRAEKAPCPKTGDIWRDPGDYYESLYKEGVETSDEKLKQEALCHCYHIPRLDAYRQQRKREPFRKKVAGVAKFLLLLIATPFIPEAWVLLKRVLKERKEDRENRKASCEVSLKDYAIYKKHKETKHPGQVRGCKSSPSFPTLRKKTFVLLPPEEEKREVKGKGSQREGVTWVCTRLTGLSTKLVRERTEGKGWSTEVLDGKTLAEDPERKMRVVGSQESISFFKKTVKEAKKKENEEKKRQAKEREKRVKERRKQSFGVRFV